MGDCKLPPTFVEGFHYVDKVKKMEYTTFGKTGLQISKISIGGGPFGTHYGDYEEAEAKKTVIEAVKCGLNYIDTAPFYGAGKSEKFLGKVLKDIPRKAYYIATKVCRYTLDVETMFDWSSKKTRESVNLSLKTLGVDYLDVVQIHDVEFAPDEEVVVNQILPVLLEFVRDGKIKHIGCTGYDLDVVKFTSNQMLQIEKGCSMILSYTRYSMFDSELSEYISTFQNNNLGIVCASGHGCGLLTNNGPQPWHPANRHLKNLCFKAAEYCKAHGVELARLAMYHFINMKGPHTFLVGMETTAILDMNLDVYYNGLSDTEMDAYKFIMKTFFDGRKMNWQGIEVSRYFQQLDELSASK